VFAAKSGIATTDLTPLIGTAIKSDVDTLLGGKFAGDLRGLLDRRGVLTFPEIHLTDEQQVAFTKTLGTLARVHESDEENIFKVSLDPGESPLAEYLKSSFYWHLDGSMASIPILASILCAKRLPPSGGETEFCNTYAAYDALPDSEKKELENLKAVHANWSLQRYIDPEPSYEQFSRARDGPSRTQPLVWKHRSGRKSLVLGATAAYVVGMEPLESMELLVRLRDWATQPQFVYRHQWKLGDMVVWDNTGTMHRALPYAVESRRLMHRTMLQGEEPFV
jgi:alpha-ketoglutarate-dependent taurine dioxygenase